MNESKLSPHHNPKDITIVIMDLQERLLPSIQNKDDVVNSNKILIQASNLISIFHNIINSNFSMIALQNLLYSPFIIINHFLKVIILLTYYFPKQFFMFFTLII